MKHTVQPVIKNKKVLVVGLGRSGLWTARFLAERGARVTVSDKKPKSGLDPEIIDELQGRGVTLDTVADYAGQGVDIISAGALTHSAPAVDMSLEILEWTSAKTS